MKSIVLLFKGAIAGAGIGFLVGVLTMDIEMPYRFGLVGMPIGASLFFLFGRK